jgi:hypothetical protein
METPVRTNFAIAAVIYPMVQGVVFACVFIPLLALGAPDRILVIAIGATFFVAAPIALLVAPRLRSKAWRQQHGVRLMAN